MQSQNRTSSPTLLILLRLVIAAIFVGVAMFFGMLLLFGFGPKAGSPILGDYLTYSAIFVGFLAIGISAALSIMTRKSAPNSDGGRGFGMLALSAIGGSAVFAFAAFFSAVAMMLEQSLGALILVIVMIIGIASRFPLAADTTKRSGDIA